MRYCHFLIIFLWFINLLKIHSQVDSTRILICNYSIKGIVIDGESKELIKEARIIIQGEDKAYYTNAKGEFVINNLCLRSYTLLCEHAGHQAILYTFNLTENYFADIVLHAYTCILESVIINVPKSSHGTSLNPTTSLTGSELEKTRGLSLAQALKNIPGVNSIQTGPTIFKPIIQGLSGNRVLILNNGVKQEGQQWGSEHAPEIDPFIANKISVIKGAASVLYGSEAMGGVILVEPRPLKTHPGIRSEINLVTLSNNRQGVASGIVDFNSTYLKGLKGRFQGTIKKAGNSATPDYYLKNTAFNEINFSWSLGYNIKNINSEIFYSQFNSTLGIFSASDVGNLTDLKRALNSNVPLEQGDFTYIIEKPKQEVQHELFKIKISYNIKKAGTLQLILSRQYNYRAEYDKHSPYKPILGNTPQTEFQITSYNINSQFEHLVFKKIAGTLGISVTSQGNTTTGTVASFIPNFKNVAGGLFLMEHYIKNEKWEFEGGIRYDVKYTNAYIYSNNVVLSPKYKFDNTSGTFGCFYHFSSNLKLQSNLGTSFRPPAINELFSNGLHQGTLRIEKGDKNLISEYAYNWNLSLNYSNKKFAGFITIFKNYIQNYIYLSPTLQIDSSGNLSPLLSLNPRGAFPEFHYHQTNASFSGIDFSFNDSLSRHFSILLKGSFLKAIDKKEKNYLVQTPPSNIEASVKYTVAFSDRVKVCYISLMNDVVFKKSKVPLYNDLKSPPPGFMLFNVEGGMEIKAGNNSLHLGISIYNLLNQRYRIYLDSFRYYADAPGRNMVIRLKIPITITNKL